jgi:hypothetical protein
MLRTLLRAARLPSRSARPAPRSLRAAHPASRSLRAAVTVALAVLLGSTGGAAVLTATGCETSQCNVDPLANPAADFRGGIIVRPVKPDASSPTGVSTTGEEIYMTSAPNGDHLNFNAGAQYRIFHKLSGCPTRIEGWVSFSRTGVDDGNEARPAGNMFEVIDVDDTSFTVRNDTCGDYWLRVIASDPVPGCGKNEEAAAKASQ